MTKRFRSNGELLQVYDEVTKEWDFVVDCCESLESTFVSIAEALESDYTLEEYEENEGDEE